LAGAVCIATGFVFFVEKRKRQHAQRGSQGARIVDVLAVTTVTGMLLATLATLGILVANRLLPENLPARGDWERYAFWCTWALALLHAFWRSAPVARGQANPAWREQCGAIAVLAVAAVALNWITTGDTLWHTIAAGYWPVAGIDLCLLSGAAIAWLTARALKRRAHAAQSGMVATEMVRV
jgi:cation transport ATPase